MTPQEAARWLSFAAVEHDVRRDSSRPVLAADLTAGIARGLGLEIGWRAFVRLDEAPRCCHRCGAPRNAGPLLPDGWGNRLCAGCLNGMRLGEQ
jgi:hypothetical protein